MAVAHRTAPVRPAPAAPLRVVAAGSMAISDVLARLGSDRTGLTAAEAAQRLRVNGPNAVRSHRARALPVLGRQLRSPLHAADVGISVESATDVAKDAADVLLLEKDLDVLADGVMEGRRIFANTMKYVLMGTSSNFGNMFSAAGASLFLSFLPMLPSQILLNNLLYDSSQLAIPTDNVDPEQLARPSRWDVGFIRRFMLFFGPVSSVFDFVTFGVMLWITRHPDTGDLRDPHPAHPVFRSHPSVPLLLAALGVVTVGTLLPATPLARTLGFQPWPGLFFAALALMVACYLVLIEIGKRWFYRTAPTGPASRHRNPGYRLLRRAARFSTADHLPGRSPLTIPGARIRVASGKRSVKLRPGRLAGSRRRGRDGVDASQ